MCQSFGNYVKMLSEKATPTDLVRTADDMHRRALELDAVHDIHIPTMDVTFVEGNKLETHVASFRITSNKFTSEDDIIGANTYNVQ